MNAPSTSSGPSGRAGWSSNGLLWFSAFILAGLLIVQGGKVASGFLAPARGNVVSRVGDFTALTFTNQGSEDLVLVLDGRGEQAFVYQIVRQKQLALVKRYDLASLFATGQRIGAGRP